MDATDRQLLRALDRIGAALVACAVILALLTLAYVVRHG